MEYRPLGRTDIKVSALCLGTMTWGQQNNAAEGHAQIDMALAHGVNFIDTAEMYSVPAQATTYGRTEEIIGDWLSHNQRDKIVLATKAAGPGQWISHIRGGPRLNRDHLFRAVESSLKRLKTDYIDLYQMHWPDRTTNFFGQLGYRHRNDEQMTAIAETVAALDELIKQGKIRHYGLSNESPWGAMRYLYEAEKAQAPPPASIQNPYSLLNRSFEVGLAEIAHRENIGLLAYSPLAFGMLTGKYRHGAQPEQARLTLFKQFSRYTNPQALAATEKYYALAQDAGLSLTQMSLAYVTSRPFVTSNIIGATNPAQLKENLSSHSVVIDGELEGKMDAIHTEHPYPAP